MSKIYWFHFVFLDALNPYINVGSRKSKGALVCSSKHCLYAFCRVAPKRGSIWVSLWRKNNRIKMLPWIMKTLGNMRTNQILPLVSVNNLPVIFHSIWSRVFVYVLQRIYLCYADKRIKCNKVIQNCRQWFCFQKMVRNVLTDCLSENRIPKRSEIGSDLNFLNSKFKTRRIKFLIGTVCLGWTLCNKNDLNKYGTLFRK